jgi:hypothetical protein
MPADVLRPRADLAIYGRIEACSDRAKKGEIRPVFFKGDFVVLYAGRRRPIAMRLMVPFSVV